MIWRSGCGPNSLQILQQLHQFGVCLFGSSSADVVQPLLTRFPPGRLRAPATMPELSAGRKKGGSSTDGGTAQPD
ncbi:hypothetical protein GTY68_31375 [Streptomyces sp. SID4926]|nr:hypothetical protein [Streptomyces sp. SID4926]